MHNCQVVWQIEKYKINGGDSLFLTIKLISRYFRLFKLPN